MMRGIVPLPSWRYDFLERAGFDMRDYARVEPMEEPEKDRVVAYTNRAARRAGARARRRGK